jgi:hypothetical protein
MGVKSRKKAAGRLKSAADRPLPELARRLQNSKRDLDLTTRVE